MQDNNSIPTQTFTEETPLDSSYPAYDGDVQKAESLLKQVGDSNPEPVIYNPGKSNNFLFGKSVGQIFGISAILLGAIIGVAIAGVLHSTSGNSGKSGDGQAVLASAGQSKQKDEQQQIINNSILEINRSTVVNKSFVANGDVLVQSNQDSANAFKIQSSNGNNILVADTQGKKITVGDQPPGNVSLAVNGDITVNGNLVSTTQGYSLSDQGLTIGGVLVCTANGCISSNSPPPTPASPTIDVANLMYLNTNQTISGTKTFSSTTTFNAKVTVNAPLQVAGNVNSTVGFSVNGTAGANFSCPSGQLLQQAVISGGIITSGSCVAGAGASVATLQEVYDASSPANIVLSPAGGPINIQDAASPLATNLFEVANNGGSTLYFAVNSLGITVTGNVNTTGQYQVGGVQISSANLSNDANLAKVNGNTTFTGNNTFSSASNSFTGNGAGLTNVNAAQLNGQNGAFYQNAGNINAGTLNDARLSNNVALLNTLQTFTGANTFSNASNSFTGNGSGLTSLNASNISSGTLNDLRLSPNVTLAGNTFNGANQLVQLTAGGILPVLNGSNLTALNASNISSGTLNDARLSANVALLNANNIFLGNNSFHLNSTALTVQDAVSPLAGNLFEVTDNAGTTKYFEVSSSGAKVGGNDVCTSAGNCVGTGGGGAIGGGGTAGKLAVFTGSGFTIGDSLLSQSGGTVTVGGNINLTSGNTYEINGSQISSANLSNDANLAKLNGNQTFTGTNTFSNASNSFTGDGAGLSNVDAAKLGGQLPGYYTNASNIASGTLNDARLSSNVALKNGNNTFTGNNVFSLNTAGLAVQDAASPLGTNLFEITDNTGATKYFTVSATALQFLGNDVCTTAGNCSGVGGGVTTPGGTAGKLAKFTASGTIGDSLVSESGGTVTVGGVLAVNTITPTASLTVGTPTQTLALQGDGSTSLSATVSGIKNSLVFAAPTVSNKTITIPNASGTVAVSASGPLSLDAAGNLTCPTCLTGGGGGGSGVSSVNTLSGDIVLAGTPNQVIITPSGNTLTFSLPQSIDTSSTPDFAGIDIGGSQISSAALSNDANLAKLNGTQTFTGANTFSNAGNSFTGDGSGLTNLNASNVATGTLNDGRLSSNVALLNRMGQVFTGDNTVKVNSANAFQVQNVNGENVMSIDTINSNLITNSNFETGTTGWQAVGSAVVSSNSSHWVYGGKSLQFVTSAGDTGVKFPVALSSSTSYTLSFYAESLSTGQNIKAGRADDGSTNTQCLFSANAFIYWNRYSCTFTTGTTSGSPYIYILSNLVNTTVIDGVMLQTGSTLNPYSVGKINTAGVFTSPIVIQGSEASGGSAANYFQVVNNDGTTAFSVDDNGNGGSKIITSSITIGGPNSTLNVTISLPTNHILQTDAYNNLFGTPAGAAGLGRVDLTPRTSGDVGEVIRGTSGQSVDLLRLQDSNGNIQSGFDMNGQIFLGKASTQTGNITLYNSGGSGSVVLDTNNPGSSNYTLHLPAENGTICTTAATSACNSAGGLSNVAYLNANQTFTGNNTFSSASNSFTGDGSGLTNLNASNVSSGTLNDGRLSSNVALLNRSGQIFTGDNTVKVNSANAFQVQNAGGNNILSVDTSANNVGLGKASTITGNLQFYNSAGTGVINLQSANTGSSNFTITLPAASGNVCLDSGNCVGTGGGGSIGGGGTANKIALFTGTGYTIGDSQLSQTGGTVTNSGNEVVNGTVLAKNTINSTAAFQVQNATGDAIFNVSTTDANNNLLSNPSGEQTLTSSNWQAKGGSAVSQDSTASWIGNNSVKTVTTATVGDGVKQNITLTNNTQYTFSAYFEASGTGITNLTPGYFDGTTENDCALSPASSNIGASQWRRFSCTFTTPASHSGTPYIYVKQSDAAVKTVWMDAIQLVTGASNPVFQEGSISLNGLVTSPVVIKVPGNTTGSVSGTASPFAVLDQSGNQVLALDVANNAGTLLLANGNLQVGNTFGVRSSGTGASLHFESDGSVYVDSSTATAGANKNTILKTGGSILLQNASSTLATVSNTGATTFQNSSNSANAFQVQNSSGTNLLNVDSTNARIGVDVTYTAMSAPTQNNTSTSTTGGTLAADTYYYKITAVDSAGGETIPSVEKSQVTTGATSTVTLSWVPVSGASGYKIYRGTTALGGSGSEVYLTTTLGTVNGANLNYVDTGSIAAGSATPPASNTAYKSTNNSNSLLQVSIGGLGTPTGQLYVSGILPQAATGQVAVSGMCVATIQGNYVYTAGSSNLLKIYDVSNPVAPVLVGSAATNANPLGCPSIQSVGNYVFLESYATGTQIFDATNPSSPSVVGTTSVAGGALKVSSSYLFETDGSQGLRIFDISNISSPKLMSLTNNIGSNLMIKAVSNNYAYLSGSNGTMFIYNVSNPAAPSLVSTTAVDNASLYSIIVRGRYAYTQSVNLGSSQTFSVYDVSNPATPTLLGSYSPGAVGTSGLAAVNGRYAYVSTSSTLYVIDASNPVKPILTGSTSGAPSIFDVKGRYAYGLSGSSLQTYDVGGTYSQSLESGSLNTGNLTVASSSYFLGSASFTNGLQVTGGADLNGNTGIGGGLNVQGSSVLGGGLNQLATPSAPTVTPQGTTGAQRWDYTITAINAYGGETLASTAGTTATGNATLTGTNFNRVTWSAVSGATSYKIYRTFTTGATSPTTTGLVGSTTALSFDDTGFAAAGSAPTVNTTGQLTVLGSSFLQAQSAATNVLTIQGAASQTGTLLLFQNSAGTTLGGFSSGGAFFTTQNNATYGPSGIGSSSSFSISISNTLTATTDNGTIINVRGGQTNQTSLLVNTSDATNKGAVIKGTASQSADLVQLQDNNGLVQSGFDPTGQLYLGRASGLTGSIKLYNSAGANTVSLVAQAVNPASSLTIQLPTVGASGAGQCVLSDTGSTTTNSLLKFGACPAGTTSQTKVVAMGSPSGCTGTVPVASLDTNADYVVNSCTSAQTTINTAITALGTTGGTVYLKEGTYIVDGQITLASNVTIKGSGMSTILKLKDGVNAGINFMFGTGITRVGVQDLKLDGNQANNTSGTQYGLYLNNVGSGNGATAVPGAKVSNVNIENFRSDAMYFRGLLNSSIVNSSVSKNLSHGISFDITQSSNDVVSGNTIQGNGGNGIYANSGDKLILSNNTIQGNTGYGIRTGSNSYTITGNLINGSGNYGIYMISSSDSTVSGNTISGGSATGVYLNSADRVAFTGNDSSGNSGSGIYATGTNFTISGNNFYNNTSSSIFIQASDSLVSNNVASTSGSYNIYDNSGDRDNISGNTVLGGSSTGIYIYSADSTNVSNNYVKGNAGPGISLDAGSANTLVNNNRIFDNGGSGNSNGINLTGGSGTTKNMISNNIITDTAGTGCAIGMSNIVPPTLTTLSNNTYSGTGASSICNITSDTIQSNQVDSSGNIILDSQKGIGFGMTPTASVSLQGALTTVALSTVAQPSVSKVGTAGSTTWGYKVTALDGLGETAASTEKTVTNGNATLDGTNYNTITWDAIGGAIQYKIYRTTAGGTPSSTGLIGTVAGTILTFNDTGIAATTAAPSSNTSGGISIQGTALFKPTTDSASAFQVQNASNTPMFTIDSGNDYVKVGSTTTDNVAVLSVLDSYNQASDPTGVNGAMYYNTSLNKFRCYQNSTWVDCAGSGGAGATLSATYNAGSTSADQTLNLDNAKGGGVILKDNSTPITGSLFSIQNSGGSAFLDVSSSKITIGENTVGNATATATSATTSGTGANTTTVALTAVNSLVNGDVIFIDNAGQDYFTRITAGGGTTSLTVDPAVTYENARTVTKYSVQYLGSDGTNFSGATRNQNSFYQGYFLGGVVTGAGSTVYSDANISSVGNLQISTASGVNIKGTNSTTAFQVQNAAGTSLFNIDSTNMRVALNQSGLSLSDLSAPTSPGVAAGATTGGTLSGAAGTTYYYKITAMSGTGESLGSSEVSINGQGFTKLTSPTAPTVGAPSAGGSVTLGTHSYKVTFVTANGETTGGTTSSQVNVTTGGTQTVPLTAIPLGATGTTQRKIYRTVTGDTGNYLLVTTIANNTSTTFNDTVADGSLGAAAPVSNTATTSTNNATVSWTAVSGATGYRVYRGTAAGAESAYQAAASSPFTDTGAAGTAGTVHTYSTVDAVGIGTSTPGASLDVEGTALFKNGANSTSAFQIQDSSGTSVLNADTNNRLIGINNSAPTATLDVIASAVSYAEGFESGTTGSFSGALWTASTTNPHTGSYSIGATTGGIGTLSVTKSMTTAGTVSFWANVQSGCCATPSTFKIDGVTQQSWSPNTTTPWTFYSFAVTSGSHTYSWAFNNTQPAYFYMDDFKLTMNTGSAYAAAFNSGNVGIGTSAPGSTLEVDGTVTFKLPTTASAFQVQNTIGSQILTVDPTNNSVSIAQGNLTVSGLTNITSVPTLTSSGTGGTLAAGTYYYQVAAVNANGTTPAIATNPTSVTTSGSTSQNTITWSAKTNASGYNVYRSTNGTNWFVNTVSAAATTLVDNGSTYTWTSAIGPPTTNTTGGNLTVKGAATFTNASNSTSALDVQDATGDSILRVDSTDRHVGINNSAPVAALDVVASPPAPDFTWGFEDGTYGALSHSGGNKISPAGAHTGSYGWWGDTCGNPSDTMTLTRSLGSAGYISFWAYLHGFWGGWNVFWIDGVAKITLPGGTIPYAQYTYPLSAGTHTFQWNTGDTCDAIYVDDITVGTNAPNSNAAVFNGGNVGIGTVAPSATLETDGTSIFKATSNVTSTFQIQNATGDSLFNADTTNTQITIGRFVDSSLSAPASPGVAAGTNTGGTLSGAAGTTYYYKVSAMTVDGETPLSSEVSINGQSFTKLTAPTAATVGAPSAGGSVTLGTHSYKVTFVTANGETTGGTTSSQVNVTTGGTQTVPLTAIPTGPTGTTQRKIYRTVAGDTGNYLLLTTIANNTTTTYNDTTVDASLGAAAPVSNTATTSTNNATISWSAVTGATSYRVYRGTASGAETAYQTAASSPFTDTGAAGTSLANTSLAVKGTTSVQNVVDSTTSFQIQNAAGASMFTVDTTNSKITLGAPSATPVLLVLGNKNTSGDPTCTDGAIYYNSSFKQFRACANGTWLSFGNNDGWQFDGDQTWTYASASSFTVSGDQTSAFTAGTRIKLTQSSTVEYFVVTSSSYSSPSTTVNITGGSDYTLANSAISANFHSYAVNPQGYPSSFSYISTLTGFSSVTAQSARFAVEGHTVYFWVYNFDGTSNSTSFSASLPIACAQNAQAPIEVKDNGAYKTTPGRMYCLTSSSTTLTFQSDYLVAGWTSSGEKLVGGGFDSLITYQF